MLQKLLAMLFSFILAITGVLPPGAIPSLDMGDPTAAPGAELPLATQGPDGSVTSVNVGSLIVEGEPVEEDRWGIGTLDEITFQVGPHVAEGATLGVGGTDVDLHPTDTLTITKFKGRFRFTDVGTSTATLLLDGVVHRTSVDDGPGGNPLTTETRTRTTGDDARSPGSQDGTAESGSTAHVVIGGDPVGNVAISRGGGHSLRTQSEAGADKATTLYATWVKVDGEQVEDYLHGEGPLGTVSFQLGPAPPGAQQTIRFDGQARTLERGRVVTLDGFLGSYLVYQVENGLNRVRLDGSAQNLTVQTADAANLGGQPPQVSFSYTSDEPTTSHTVSFRDHSFDPDGHILLTEWRFGDGDVSFKQNPHHRYDDPGLYTVKLTVTDSDLHTVTRTLNITIGNTLPTAEFGWTPTDPTDLDEVHFTAKAWDGDGDVVERYWDLGDGNTATGSTVDHTYADDGTYTVTLTVRDDAGGWDNVSKVVHVRNVPPDVSFTWNPENPQALTPVTFTNTSTDPDGRIVSSEWTVEGHGTFTTAQPSVTFHSAGNYTVTLEQTDDDGDVSETTETVHVRNLPPEANFTWTPATPVTAEIVHFDDRSVDRDGSSGIASYHWEFGDGNTSDDANPSHAYQSLGTYTVTLTVTDHHGDTDTVSKTVNVANAPPIADFTWTPDDPTDLSTVGFTDTTRDPDDDIVRWSWSFGDGNTSTDANPEHRYPDDALYNVTLTVEDSTGQTDTVTRGVLVGNVPPTVNQVTRTPHYATSRDTLQFSMATNDPDGTIQNRYWILPNGTEVHNATLHVQLPEGVHVITAVAVDDDGADGRLNESLRIYPAGPLARFTYTPTVPGAGQEVEFVDQSDAGDAPIQSRRWSFDDGTRVNGERATHVFDEPGEYRVSLRVEDTNGKVDRVYHDIQVLPPPEVSISVEPQNPRVDQPTWLNATATPSTPDANITSITWTLPDGSTATGANTTHTFDSYGTFNVTVQVEDSNNAQTTETQRISVRNTPPTASFTHTPTAPMVGESASFTNTSTDPDGYVDRVHWNLGDGTTSGASTLQHTYGTSGTYPVTLTAYDDAGAQDRVTRDLRVVNDHLVRLIVSVNHPDGHPVDLTRPDLTTSFTVLSTGLANVSGSSQRPVTTTANGTAEATFLAGEWAGGEPIEFRLQGSQIEDVTLTIEPPAEAYVVRRGPVVAPFAARMDLAVQGNDYRTNATEPVDATVNVVWTTGRPVVNEPVVVFVDYQPPVDSDLQRRLHEVTGETDANGTFTFTVPATVTEDKALYLPGTYDMLSRTCTHSNENRPCTFARSSFLMDPEGVLRETGAEP